MRASEFEPTYLPATAPCPVAPDSYVEILGIGTLDGTDLAYPVDYHHPEAITLRMTHVQARHLYRSLGHTLDMDKES